MSWLQAILLTLQLIGKLVGWLRERDLIKAGEAKAYEKDKLDASTARSLMLIKLGVSAPAPAMRWSRSSTSRSSSGRR